MKVLVLGDGLLGSELVKQTGWDCASRKLTGLDITKYFDLERLILKYDTVVNCIANTDSYSNDKKLHFEINYDFVEALCSITFPERIKLVHISTEFVYANNKIPPTEDEIPQHDATWYAYTKLLADEHIQQNHDNYLICRELHKPNPFQYDKIWEVQTSGDTVDKIAELIIKLINTNAQGVFNVGTGDKWLWEMATGPRIEVTAPTHVPKDTRMNLDKLTAWLSEN
jgi:dTDP-4-dehydrorhamnose reductase